jgi:predicted Zn-dependent protease with MMP-like domain
MGLFLGQALTEQEYGVPHPNRVVLFKHSIEAASRSRDEIAYEIRRTVIHELAHHFGFSEDDLEEFESMPSPFDGDEPTEEQ